MNKTKKLAILILAHEDPVHLSKLVKALDYNADFYIHIDRKSDIQEFRDSIPDKNVFFVKNRVYISWAGFSMIDALINLIEEVLRNKEKYSHALFITGSCYPIKNVKSIHQNLTSKPKKEFISFFDMRESPEHYMKLVNQKWFKDSFFNSKNKFIKKFDSGLRFLLNQLRLKNKWHKKIIPYSGHTWCALTMDCCNYIFEYHTNNPWFKKMNQFTFAVDEHYIHTIIGNSPFMDASLGKNDYKGRGLYKYTNTHLIHESLQKWYDLKDWPEIIQSDKWFVRKVNSKTGNDLVSKINKELLADTPQN